MPLLLSHQASFGCRHASMPQLQRPATLPGTNLAANKCSRRPLLVVSAGHPGATSGSAVKTQGFIGEMRKVAMKNHTRDQAPKEGGKAASKTPMSAWQPTREGYVRFLAESKAVYDAFDSIMSSGLRPEYTQFQNTGLERSAALAADLQWFDSTYGIKPPAVKEDGPGQTYVRLLQELAQRDPPAFICHYYNYYFAHTAGGRMIGKKISSMVLDNAQLQFYEWEGDVEEMLDAVRTKINALAESWTDEQRTRCLQETENTFKCSGMVMRCITEP